MCWEKVCYISYDISRMVLLIVNLPALTIIKNLCVWAAIELTVVSLVD